MNITNPKHPKNTLDARIDAEVQRQEDVEQGLSLLMRLPPNPTHGDLRQLMEAALDSVHSQRAAND